MAFDILMLNGEDLRDQSFATRKAVLKQFIRGLETLRGAKHIQYVEHSETPRQLFEDLIERGGEGTGRSRQGKRPSQDAGEKCGRGEMTAPGNVTNRC